MPANHKVTVAWQIVFTFLPIVNFWAFYRIRKLRKYCLYVIVPVIATAIFVIAYPQSYISSFSSDFWAADDKVISEMQLTAGIMGNVIGWGLQGSAIYLSIIWSRQHNRTFDTPQSTQPQS